MRRDALIPAGGHGPPRRELQSLAGQKRSMLSTLLQQWSRLTVNKAEVCIHDGSGGGPAGGPQHLDPDQWPELPPQTCTSSGSTYQALIRRPDQASITRGRLRS